MSLATAGADGRPSARIVLLKGVEAGGFVFYTNYQSRKGHVLAANPHAALLFYDYLLSEEGNRQIAQLGYAPTNRHLESPLTKLRVKVLNASALLDESAKSTALFDDVIIKRTNK